MGHFVEQFLGGGEGAELAVHVDGAAGDEVVRHEAKLDGEGVDLDGSGSGTEGCGRLEEAGEGEVVGGDCGGKHGGEEGEGERVAAVLGEAGDESGEGNDGGGTGDVVAEG